MIHFFSRDNYNAGVFPCSSPFKFVAKAISLFKENESCNKILFVPKSYRVPIKSMKNCIVVQTEEEEKEDDFFELGKTKVKKSYFEKLLKDHYKTEKSRRSK